MLRFMLYQLFPVLGLAVLAGGCTSPCCSTGWRFEIVKPPIVQAPAAISETSPALMVAPISAYPAGLPGPARPSLALSPPSDCCSSAGSVPGGSVGPVLAARPDCTLPSVCDKLDQLERRVQAITAERLPMPKGQP